MKYSANITIMPLKALLDPQGKAVTAGMANLNLSEITNVRVGRHITLEIESPDRETASQKVEEACKKLLANPIIESYEFDVKES